MTNRYTLALGLVRQARTSGDITDEFLQAALIDAEVDLEDLAPAAPAIGSPAPLNTHGCIEQAIQLLDEQPATSDIRTWLHKVLAGLPS
ncbi:hypothetical protein BJY21_003216 [Kineosphaera limosa]|uniref:Uncharacterized protein n=1 Tax=Kineosphaera limosa NBRC 100340 TaxID=1184609 RepID=K6WF41_9MICO|nr:hypothetical protein [Kineosphaera limosa]NYE02032.1 hypothetical protein [Kineosphaera limosa]GAB97900.1 hypothetical protein KILIM_087_00050 [Kineosphaera limosa NBRC 100340]